MKFEDLEFQSHQSYPTEGIAAKVFFDNGFGASVVRFPGSYGYHEGLYEMAVISGNEDEWELRYDTPITDDVIGWLSEEDVTKKLQEIESIIYTPQLEKIKL